MLLLELYSRQGNRFTRPWISIPKGGSKKIPERVYKLFPVLKKMKNCRGGNLSDVQQLRLVIGRPLAIGPRPLILEELGEGIQPNIVAQIGEVLCRLIEEKCTHRSSG